MECIRCGNKDPTYFYKGHNGYYCRKCIRFKRILFDEDLEPFDYEVKEDASNYFLKYELTEKQKQASNKCLSLLNGKDVLLYCVCGAGKTEISIESISYYLSKGLKVAYAISRKEVVIELGQRFSNIFKDAKVVSVYGGHHKELTGDLIVLTTHQLYRYYKTFDLLILDEVDAFPLKGNEVLMNISLNACKGRIIFSTATVDETLNKVLKTRNYERVELYTRPSNKPLIVPKVIINFKFLCFIALFLIMHSMTNQCIIFTQSIKTCEQLHKVYSLFYNCTFVHSNLDKRKQNIDDFKNKKYQFIFATTVLERGITIKDVNVIIVDFIPKIFDVSNYIQMLGRVGRSIENPYGLAYILTNRLNSQVRNAVTYLKKANSYL